MIPSPTELRYFLEIAGTLNMSRAAERLGVSQPALTLAMGRLEESFGQKVLVRGKTGVQLSKAGEKLATQARVLLDAWERIKSEATKDEKELGGRYTIGCHTSVALYTLPHFLPGLLSEFPHLQIGLHHDLSRRITEDVISFKVDFGIVVNPVPHPELIIKPLYDDTVTLWVGPEHSPLSNPKSEGAVLILEPDLLQSQDILRQLAKRKMYFKRVIHSSNLEVITGLAAAGAGVAVLPGRVATRLKAYGLKPIDKSVTFHDKISMIYRADAQKSEASKILARRIYEMLQAVK